MECAGGVGGEGCAGGRADEVGFVFGGEEVEVAGAGKEGDAGAHDGPIAGEEQNLGWGGAEEGVEVGFGEGGLEVELAFGVEVHGGLPLDAGGPEVGRVGLFDGCGSGGRRANAGSFVALRMTTGKTRATATAIGTRGGVGSGGGVGGWEGGGGGGSGGVADAAPKDAQGGDDGDGDEGADDSGNFPAGEDGKDLQERVNFKGLAHDAGGADVVLGEAPDAEEQDEPDSVGVAGEDGDGGYGDGSNGWTDDRDEFEEAGEGTEHDGVGNAQDAEDDGVGDKGEAGENDLRADVAAKHDVDVTNETADGAALNAGAAEVDSVGSNLFPLLEEEEAEDGDENKPPDVLGGCREVGCGGFGVIKDVGAVILEQLLDLELPVAIPVVMLAELSEELAGGDAIYQGWKATGEGAGFVGELWTGEEADAGEDADKQEVDQGDCAATAAERLLEAGNEGREEIGEEDGKKKEGDGVAGEPEEGQASCDHQHREKDAGGAAVPELVEKVLRLARGWGRGKWGHDGRRRRERARWRVHFGLDASFWLEV